MARLPTAASGPTPSAEAAALGGRVTLQPAPRWAESPRPPDNKNSELLLFSTCKGSPSGPLRTATGGDELRHRAPSLFGDPPADVPDQLDEVDRGLADAEELARGCSRPGPGAGGEHP